MNVMPSCFTRSFPGLAVVALIASSCASSPPAMMPDAAAPKTTAPAPSIPAAEQSTPPPAADQALPAVQVIDLANDARVNVASLAPADKPVLVWMWAPH